MPYKISGRSPESDLTFMQVLVTHTRKRELVIFNISPTLWGYSSAKTHETYTKMAINVIN